MKSNLTKGQYDSLESLMRILKKMKVIGPYSVISNQYYDTIEGFKHTPVGVFTHDASWQPFFTVEEIVMVEK